jgi:hypothetical protein
MTDEQRLERAIWKLEQGGYWVTPADDGRYLIANQDSIAEVANLAELVAFAEAVYDRVWTGRKITPSA